MFLYFLPDCDTQTPDLAAYGLTYAFDGPPVLMEGQKHEGRPGMLACSQQDEQRLRYDANRQTWVQAPGGRYYIGWWLEEGVPTPENLLRPNAMGGDLVELADGNLWLVPKLRVYETSIGFTCALPTKVALNDDGEWQQGSVLAPYKRLDSIADRLLEGMLAAEDSRLSDEERPPRLTRVESLDLACEILAVNYRVSRLELSEACLGVLALDHSLRAILKAASDFAAMEKDAKKKLAASAASRG